MRKREWLVPALLLGALAFALLGQYYLSYRREFYRDGILFYAVALLLFGVGVYHMRRPRRSRRPSLPRPRSLRSFIRPLAALGGVLFSFLAGWFAVRRPPEEDFTGLLWMWLLGLAWFLLAFVPPLPPRWPSRVADWVGRHRGELLRVVALLIVALLVRGVALDEIPRNLGGDEGTWGLHGLAMVEGEGIGNPFATRWFDFPSMSFLVWGLSMRVFGETVTGLRAVSAIIGVVTVLTTYLLARDAWGRWVGIAAAFLLTFGHYHMHYSRLAVNNIADGLFLTLCFWLLLRGLRSERRVYFALAGGVMGLAWYAYMGARLMPIILAVYLGVRVVFERGFLQRHWRNLVLMAMAAVVAALPLLLYYLRYPSTFASRYQQVSIFASGWLAQAQAITGRSVASLLLEQVWKSISAFHYTVDPTFWYRPGTPLLDFVSGVLILFGMGWAIVRGRWRVEGLLLTWFWLAVLFGWILNENPPSSQRLVIVGPALAALVALGAHWLLGRMRALLDGPRVAWAAVAAAILGTIAILNLSFYFLEYVPTRVYGNPASEISDVLADELEARDEVPPVYFNGAPYMYWDFGTIAFRLRHVEGQDFNPEVRELESYPERGALFVILERNLGNLTWLQEHFPNGSTEHFYSEANGNLLFVLYELPPRGGE
jgi:4-amino-4-deoxy-L-arabinose transferase-like glycosyltransferase